MRIYSLWKAIISHFSNLNNHMRALILFNLKVQKGVHAGYFMSIRVNPSGLIALRGGAVDVNPRRGSAKHLHCPGCAGKKKNSITRFVRGRK